MLRETLRRGEGILVMLTFISVIAVGHTFSEASSEQKP